MNRLKGKRGQTMVEYIIIVVIIAIAAIAIFGVFGDTIRAKLGGAVEERPAESPLDGEGAGNAGAAAALP